MIDGAFWRGKRVLVTGHTGFKGGWLCHWLHCLGARVSGFALDPLAPNGMFDATGVAEIVDDQRGDVRNPDEVRQAVEESGAEIVFHLAAQPLVRWSYTEPVETFDVNVMGTVHVLDAIRLAGTVRAAVVVTSDKCYANRETREPYRESDAMGGHDPYSASKGCAELVTSAYRKSFFGDSATAIASARAGNVIGGGDWGMDRIVPDCMRAFQAGLPVVLRRPSAVRPWQHVLEPLGGYLRLAEALWKDARGTAGGYNFGPRESECRSAEEVARLAAARWGNGARVECSPKDGPHEAGLLLLDSSLAAADLGWQPRLRLETAVELTAEWYRRQWLGEHMGRVTQCQIESYASLAGAPAEVLESEPC